MNKSPDGLRLATAGPGEPSGTDSDLQDGPARVLVSR